MLKFPKIAICLRALGFRNRLLRSCLSDAGDEALRRSFWIWLKWTKWKDYNQRSLSWKSISYSDPKLVRFGIGCTYDTLFTEIRILILSHTFA